MPTKGSQDRKLPHTSGYTPWSSRNVRLLQALEDNFDDPGFRPTDVRTPEELEGRAHREEAYLIQLKGEDNGSECVKCVRQEGVFSACRSVGALHRGACGCCVWQSKAMDCSLALNAIEAEAEQTKRRSEAKEALRESRKVKASSKNTSRTKAADEAARDARIEEERLIRTPTKGKKKARP